MRIFFYRKSQIIQNITSLVMNLPTALLPEQFITNLVMNFRQPIGVCLVEQSKVAQIGDGKPFAVPYKQPFRKLRQYFFPICRTFITYLQFLNNFAPDQPVGDHHRAVDRIDNLGPCPIQNGHDTIKQAIAA